MSTTAYLAPTHARWLRDSPGQVWRRQDATLVFADVSGFTAMSEKLARHGKIGAEETTAAITLVFTGLLEAATARGGEILKFGGDAVLALFAGDHHALRGAAAALDMQRGMRALGRVQTESGAVRLRLSVGVASGEALLFCVGGAPRDLLPAGPLATAVVGCEAAADAGEVVVDAATARLVGEHGLGAPKGPGRLLKAVRSAPPAPPAPGAVDTDPRPGLPAHLHDHEPADGEHRFASIAFVHFSGVDAEAGDPDRLAALLNGILVTVGAACERHRVTLVSTDVDRDGGKVILAAGAPRAGADDEDRLVHALRDVLAVNGALRVRAGVHRGRVFVGDIGTDRRRVWTVMGDAVNVAARVMSHAEPGQLLATPTLLERLRDDFERTPVAPFMVKGKRDPMFAELVGPARGTRRATTGRMAPLVGREAELATITAALADARAGETRIVELVGEPGMGKSRLVEAALARAGDWVRVAGGPYSAHTPYLALRRPLRHLLGVAADAGDAEVEAALRARIAADEPRLEPWLPLVAVPFGLDLEPTPETASLVPEFARERLHGLVGSLIGLLIGARPGLLVIEDAHWLDEASSGFLRHLARQRRPGAGSLVLVTRRAGSPSVFAALAPTTIALAPLDPASAGAMLAGGDEAVPLPPGAAETLIERAGGNPLLLQELVNAARAGRPLDELPDSVEALVMENIDALAARDRHFVRQAAVLGVHVPVDLLGALVEQDAATVAADVARLSDFFVADGLGRVRFRHALVRDGAYEALSYRLRRALHARVAELVERRAGADAEAQAELLAIHFHRAAHWEQTWRYARLAADHAFARAAPVEAIGFIGRALEAARALDKLPRTEIAHAIERQGDAAQLAGRPEEAIRAWRQARRHLRDDGLACARLLYKEGRQLEAARNVSQGLASFTRGLRALDRSPATPEAQRLRAQLVLAHGAGRARAGRLREALPYLEEAVRLARPVDGNETLAHAFYVLEWVHTDLGTGLAERYRGLALPIFEALGDSAGAARVLINDGATAYYDGRWDDAVALYERAADECRRIGDVTQAASTLANIAELRTEQNRLDEAEPLLREALAVWRSAGYGLGVGFALSNLGRVVMRQGDHARAFEIFAEARTTLEANGAESLVLEVEVREASCWLRVGEPARALAMVGRVRNRARELGALPSQMSILQRMAGEAKLALGDRDGARVRFAEAIELARSVGARYEEGVALVALGRMGDAEATARGRAILDDLGVVGDRASAAAS